MIQTWIAMKLHTWNYSPNDHTTKNRNVIYCLPWQIHRETKQVWTITLLAAHWEHVPCHILLKENTFEYGASTTSSTVRLAVAISLSGCATSISQIECFILPAMEVNEEGIKNSWRKKETRFNALKKKPILSAHVSIPLSYFRYWCKHA